MTGVVRARVPSRAWQRAQFDACASAMASDDASSPPSIQAAMVSASRHDSVAAAISGVRSSRVSASSSKRSRSRSAFTKGPQG